MKKPKKKGVPPGMSDAAVQAKTGKTWPEWFAVLDAAGAKKMSHKEIVAYLVQHHDVGPWWRQMVTVTYEQARGLRAKHEKPEGYAISVSKTIEAPLGTAYNAWQNEKARARWLVNDDFTVRTATKDKTLRATWSDGKTSLEVRFYAKGNAKCQVVVQHSKLPGAKAAATMKKFWGEALGCLKQVLEG